MKRESGSYTDREFFLKFFRNFLCAEHKQFVNSAWRQNLGRAVRALPLMFNMHGNSGWLLRRGTLYLYEILGHLNFQFKYTINVIEHVIKIIHFPTELFPTLLTWNLTNNEFFQILKRCWKFTQSLLLIIKFIVRPSLKYSATLQTQRHLVIHYHIWVGCL